MKIVADSNIPFVNEAFMAFGEVELLPGRDICRSVLIDAEMLLVRSVTRVDSGLLEGTSVRFVGTATAGIDHLDTSYLDSKGIGFGSAPGSNSESVAEYIASVLVHLSRQNSMTLEGKVLGVIGAGHVGARLPMVASALGMKCLLNDPPLARVSPNFCYHDLDYVLNNSDIVTLHVPLLKSGIDATLNMADYDFFDNMKRGSVFINSSRGSVMSEEDLVKNRSKFSGVILDVWNNEPYIDEKTVNIADIATPHIAGHSFDGKVNGTRAIFSAACKFFGSDRTWDDSIDKNSFEERILDLRNSGDPVFDAMDSVYPVMKDDEALRGILSQKDRGVKFEQLRKNYAKRYEFRHFQVICSDKQGKEAMVLAGLGFRTA
jgi:erythronate-4-phosphate dehydrogenase